VLIVYFKLLLIKLLLPALTIYFQFSNQFIDVIDVSYEAFTVPYQDHDPHSLLW